jgi:hypothetical protein
MMMNEAMSWMFWFGVAACGYSGISAFVRYVHHRRRGALIMASQANLQSVISTAGLMLLWYLHRT